MNAAVLWPPYMHACIQTCTDTSPYIIYTQRPTKNIFENSLKKNSTWHKQKPSAKKKTKKPNSLSCKPNFSADHSFLRSPGKQALPRGLEDGVVSTEGLFKNQLPAPPCFCTSITRDKNKNKKSEVFSKALSPGWLISLWTVLGTVKRCVRSGWWY